MANKKFVVELDGSERARLGALISKGKAPAKTILKARILLMADEGDGGAAWTDNEICEALDTNVTMVARVRQTLVEDGLDAVLTRKTRQTPPIAPIFDGEAEAKLIALACSTPPAGHARWTIRLLAAHVVERKIVEAWRVDDDTVRLHSSLGGHAPSTFATRSQRDENAAGPNL